MKMKNKKKKVCQVLNTPFRVKSNPLPEGVAASHCPWFWEDLAPTTSSRQTGMYPKEFPLSVATGVQVCHSRLGYVSTLCAIQNMGKEAPLGTAEVTLSVVLYCFKEVGEHLLVNRSWLSSRCPLKKGSFLKDALLLHLQLSAFSFLPPPSDLTPFACLFFFFFIP